MLVAEKYRFHRQVGWSDEAEVHAGPVDATHRVPLAVKLRHGQGGPPRPDGNRERFLRAVAEQRAALEAGCRHVAPIFDAGHEGENAYYVTEHFPRSLDSLIQGRVALDVPSLHRVVDGALRALEELRDKQSRAHGNLKPTNLFLSGKTIRSATVMLSDLALREAVTGGEGADCYALGTIIFQLVRGRTIRRFDWPIVRGPDWDKLGPQADDWREFCNVLMSPETSANPAALSAARAAYKNMRRLGAAAAKSARHVGDPGETGSPPPRRRRTGLFVSLGAAFAALLAAGAMLLQPPSSTLGRQLRALPVLAILFQLVDAHAHAAGTGAGGANPDDGTTPGPDQSPVADASPSPGMDNATASPSPADMASPTPALAEASPTPLPTPNPGDKWIGYAALLGRLNDKLRDPALLDQPEMLTDDLGRLKESVEFLPINGEASVQDFLKKLPPKIEATGNQPDLPANLWTKGAVSHDEDVQSVVYEWGHTGFKLPFNRVSPVGGNGTAFYLSAMAVPMRFGIVLAKLAEADGKGQLSGATSVKGPVSWQYAGGSYSLRASWMVLDSVNGPYYASASHPSYDSPMNGLSAIEAARLARAAGCSLPTLAQWGAVMASPSGQKWVSGWLSGAKVRGATWSAFAKNIQSQHVTGAKLPNEQCFGDRNDLNPVGQSADGNLFFEPVNTRMIGGFAHLIGNIGQYLVDDARSPGKYYFAGGSAESPPAVFQSLTSPPTVVSPFLSAADGGLRLAIAAKGNGSEKNPALDTLKTDLAAELARVQKLQ